METYKNWNWETVKTQKDKTNLGKLKILEKTNVAIKKFKNSNFMERI